jgi:hypothetical protein
MRRNLCKRVRRRRNGRATLRLIEPMHNRMRSVQPAQRDRNTTGHKSTLQRRVLAKRRHEEGCLAWRSVLWVHDAKYDGGRL